MRHPYSKFLLLFLVILCLFCSCQNESKVFVGQWQDERSPENVWEIKKSGSTFTGTRISGDDFYKYDTEQWKFELRSNGDPMLLPMNEDGGSSLRFQAEHNRFIRNPPGRTYVKVTKAK